MAEYNFIRFLLGATLLVLAWTLARQCPRYLGWFLVYCIISGAYLVIPGALTPDWFRSISLPMSWIRYGMACLACLRLVRAVPIPRREIRLAGVAGWLVGAGFVRLGYFWLPENSFQAQEITLQYELLLLAGCFSCFWAYVTWLRPVALAPGLAVHGWLWAAWVFTAFLLATTTKHGLAWTVVEWQTGLWWWRLLSDLGMAVQIGLAVTWITRFQRCLAASPSPSPDRAERSHPSPVAQFQRSSAPTSR